MFRRSPKLPTKIQRQIRTISTERVLAWAEGEVVQEKVVHPTSSKITEKPGAPSVSDQPKVTYEPLGQEVCVVLTPRRLVLAQPATDSVPVSYWWHETDRASWRPEDRVFMVSFTTGVSPLCVKIGQELPMEFLSLLRDRIESSIVISETVPLTSAESARIAVRKDEYGDLFVQAVCDAGVDVENPVVVRTLAPVVARMREVSGAR